MDSQIPFFCGDSLECRTLGSSVALKGAIRNIQLKVGHLGLWKTKLMRSFHKLKSIIRKESSKYKDAHMDHPVRQSLILNSNQVVLCRDKEPEKAIRAWCLISVQNTLFLNLRNWNVWNSNLEINNFIFVRVSPECSKTKVSVIIKGIYQFVTVGVLEQLDVSLSVMECLMKDFMMVRKTFERLILNESWVLGSDRSLRNANVCSFVRLIQTFLGQSHTVGA